MKRSVPKLVFTQYFCLLFVFKLIEASSLQVCNMLTSVSIEMDFLPFGIAAYVGWLLISCENLVL